MSVCVYTSVCDRFVLLPSGTSSMPQDRTEQGCEDLPPDHQKLLWKGDVWQGQSEVRIGQGCASVHEREGECRQRGMNCTQRHHFVVFHWNSVPDGSLIKHTLHMLAVSGKTSNFGALCLIFLFTVCLNLLTPLNGQKENSKFEICIMWSSLIAPFFRFNSSLKKRLRTFWGKEHMAL